MKKPYYLLALLSCLIIFFTFVFVNFTQRHSVYFEDVTFWSGLKTDRGPKYGAPVIADLNNDDWYDLILFNHHKSRVMHFESNKRGGFVKKEKLFWRADTHGVSVADYDQDNDLDVLIIRGSGSLEKPNPPILLNQHENMFVNIASEAGIPNLGMRGRMGKWADLDNDGDLDFFVISRKPDTDIKPIGNLIYNYFL